MAGKGPDQGTPFENPIQQKADEVWNNWWSTVTGQK